MFSIYRLNLQIQKRVFVIPEVACDAAFKGVLGTVSGCLMTDFRARKSVGLFATDPQVVAGQGALTTVKYGFSVRPALDASGESDHGPFEFFIFHTLVSAGEQIHPTCGVTCIDRPAVVERTYMDGRFISGQRCHHHYAR